MRFKLTFELANVRTSTPVWGGLLEAPAMPMEDAQTPRRWQLRTMNSPRLGTRRVRTIASKSQFQLQFLLTPSLERQSDGAEQNVINSGI